MATSQPAQKFEDLIVWRKSHQLTLLVYKLTSRFPRHEIYGLSSQMRRAAVSVPANIAEGFKKRGRADKARFMNTAQASLEELRYYFILARDLEYLTAEQAVGEDIEEISRMLGSYAQKLLTPAS